MVDASELRTDLVSGELVVVAPGRAARPGAWGELEQPDPCSALSCPFCEGREAETPPELHVHAPPDRKADTSGWRTRLFPNKFPAFGDAHAVAANAPFLSEPAAGVQDVLVHTPDHEISMADLSPLQLREIAAAWRWRATTGLPSGCLYTHVVVNEGSAAGASLAHSHSQIFSLPHVPPRVRVELERQAGVADCLVCSVVSAERTDAARVIAKRNKVLAYCPHASRFPYEVVVAPIECDADVFSSERLEDALDLAATSLRALRAQLGWAPANLWLSTSPHVGARTHWRLAVVPRLTTPAGLELGAGISVNPVDPEAAAAAIRQRLD